MNRRFTGWIVVLAALAVAVGLSLRDSRTAAPPAASASGASSAPAPAARPATLELRVTGPSSPISGAKVGLALGDDLVASGYTNPDGELVLPELAPGRFRLIVSHSRHLRRELELEVTTAPMRLHVQLVSAAVLRAKVVDATGLPIGGATVRVSSGERERGRCETRDEGICEIGELEPGIVTVYAHSGRHRPRQIDLQLRGLVEHTLRLDAGRVLSGRVVDDTGAAVVGAKVGSSDPSGGFATSDDAGAFRLSGLGDSPVNLFASSDGFAPRQLRAVRPGSANLEIRLEKPASIEARVELAGAARSLMVSVCEYDAHFAHEVCIARRLYEPPEPAIVLDGLPSGTYDLVLEASGHHTERVRIRLTSDRRASAGVLRLRAE